MATPPAIVAFKTTSMSSLPLHSLANKHADITLVPIERYVLIMALCCYTPEPRAALKEGQYMNRKRVPTIATMLVI